MESSYKNLLSDLVERIGSETGPGIAPMFHAVRKIPYGAAGNRDPKAVYENNIGSCSGKHILLRDLLRAAEFDAEIVTIFTHFNKAIPDNESFPPELRRLVNEGDICDFHHYVRARSSGAPWQRLDATWHDALVPYGFPVNADWQGEGDTELAAETIREYPPEEDIASFKVRLLQQLTSEQRHQRARFFTLLGDWIADL